MVSIRICAGFCKRFHLEPPVVIQHAARDLIRHALVPSLRRDAGFRLPQRFHHARAHLARGFARKCDGHHAIGRIYDLEQLQIALDQQLGFAGSRGACTINDVAVSSARSRAVLSAIIFKLPDAAQGTQAAQVASVGLRIYFR